MSNKVLIGVAWPYVNGDIHVGHLGGYLLPADIVARFHRLKGDDVLMVSGSDCYGTPITVEADKKGLKPEEVVDIYHKKDLALFQMYGLDYNLYTKTTTQKHKEVVHEIFLKLLDNDYIEKGVMQQYYAIDDKQFLPDRYVEGTCPYCKTGNQRSDQCESCGRWLKDGELIDPVSKLTGSKVTLKDTEHYFLNFEKLEPQLRKYLDSNKENWKKWVWNEANGWLKEGLQRRAITRDMDWSIDLPIEEIKKRDESKQLKDFTGKHIYVWFEAVIGYLSATRAWCEMDEATSDTIFKRDEGQSRNWEDWWKNPESVIYNFMGQDNLVFHALMWPGQLMGLSDEKTSKEDEYSLPKYVVVNKFLNYEGKKFSKSRNWTIDSKVIAEKYGVDLVRYYIARNLPENKEGNFTWEDFVASVNNELVANMGNLVNRTFTFIKNKFGGEIKLDKLIQDKSLSKFAPRIFENVFIYLAFKRYEDEKRSQIETLHRDKLQYNPEEDDWLTTTQFEKISRFISSPYNDEGFPDGNHGPWLVQALDTIMGYSMIGNLYFDQQKVWEIIKTDEEKAKQILMNLVNFVYDLSILIYPFIPEASNRIRKMLNMDPIKPQIDKYSWKSVTSAGDILSEVKLGDIELLFNKLDPEKVLSEKDNIV